MSTIKHSAFALKKVTFGQRIFIFVMAVALLSVLSVAVPLLYNSLNGYEKLVENKTRSDAVIMSSLLATSLSFDRPDLSTAALDIFKQSNNVVGAMVYRLDPDGIKLTPFASYGTNLEGLGETSLTSHELLIQRKSDYILALNPIRDGDMMIGYLQLRVSLAGVNESVKETLLYMLAAGIGAVVVALYLANLARISIIRPVGNLSDLAKKIAATQNYSIRAEPGNADEIGALIESFNTMLDVIQAYDSDRKQREKEIIELNQTLERKVQERTNELQKNMLELAKTVQTLKDTQAKLVEQEKMASLGGLVAGVAHEINTPIGVAITASSHLEQCIGNLRNSFSDGSLTKRIFSEMVDEQKETVSMVLKNLERAAKLVRSFKLVAVDQANEDKRDFNLKEYAGSVLESLTPQLKRSTHKVHTDIPDGIVIVSFPGAISQILTNLVMNSLMHGFDAMENGRIDINIREQKGVIHLDYFDNGKGIPNEIKHILFEPFVTTARSKGGSGLGTHILYNLVTQVLNGSVRLLEDVQQGVHFHIEFPAEIIHSKVIDLAGGQK